MFFHGKNIVRSASVVKVYMYTQRAPINGVKATINVQQMTTTNASPSSPYKRDCTVLCVAVLSFFAFFTVKLMLPYSINTVCGFRETGETFLNNGKNFPDSALVRDSQCSSSHLGSFELFIFDIICEAHVGSLCS